MISRSPHAMFSLIAVDRGRSNTEGKNVRATINFVMRVEIVDSQT